MSLKNIEIPPFVLANFFQHNLVILDIENKHTNTTTLQTNVTRNSLKNTAIVEDTTVTETATSIAFLGNNAKKICLLVQQPNQVFISDEGLQLITKMLSACKLTLNDVAIVNIHTAPINITILQQQLKPTIILLFNITTQQLQLPFSIPMYQIQQYNGYAIVQVAAIEKMLGESREEKIEKKKLWDCLQLLFNLK